MNYKIFYFSICIASLIAGLLLFCYSIYNSQRPVIIIEWSTASEFDTAGFNLYRSELPEGEFQKVNEDMIRSSQDPLLGADYKFTDLGVKPNKTYYYQLEEVETSGKKKIIAETSFESKKMGWLAILISITLIAFGGFFLYKNRHVSMGK